MGILHNYRVSKSVQKAAEPPAIVAVLSALLLSVVKRYDLDLEPEYVVAICTGLYGAYRGVRNWVKNHPRKARSSFK